MKDYYVYILFNHARTLYTGVTSNLELRIRQHKQKAADGFTKRYNISRLAYFETYDSINAAIAREKQIKGWTRAKKIALIEESNPQWRDISLDWQ